MAILTAEQVVALARGAGIPGNQLATCVAIAKAESGFQTHAAGDLGIQTEVWGASIGLWQIRSLKADFQTGRTRDAQKLTDPAFNAASMAVISKKGTDWRPWTVYTTGAYRKHLAEAEKAIAIAAYVNPGDVGTQVGEELASDPVTGPVYDAGVAVGEALEPLEAIGKLAAALTDGETWVRVVEVVAGMAALVVGAVLLSKEVAPSAVGAVTSVVGMAAA